MSSEHQHSNTFIHFDNYEEFFLLYIDQELSESERKAVEHFLDLHPELKEEMHQLTLTKCRPEKMPIFDKSGLFKNHVDISNAETLQLLLIDDELDKETKVALQEFMSENPASQNNFQILLQTKLPHEEVIFPNKEILLKKNHVRILSIRRISIAVAASLIFIWGIRLFLSNDPSKVDSSDLIVSGERKINNPIGTIAANTKSNTLPTENKIIQSATKPLRQIHPLPSNRNVEINSKKDDQHLMAQEKNPSAQNSIELAKTDLIKSNNLPVREIIPNSTINPESEQSSEQVVALSESVKDNYATEALTNITPVSYRENEENEQERVGLKKLIRTANRLYNKVTHPEPDKTIIRFAKTEIGIPR